MPTISSTIILVSNNPDYPVTSNVSTVTTQLNWDFDPGFKKLEVIAFPPTNGNQNFECRSIKKTYADVSATGIGSIHYEYVLSSSGVPQT